jgi:probable HAF family extracellular repeat protein
VAADNVPSFLASEANEKGERRMFYRRVVLSILLTAIFALTLKGKAQEIDEGTGAGLQCSGSAVNDHGIEVGACTTQTGASSAFVAVTAGVSVDLPPLVANGNCKASMISNNGTIVGSCQDVQKAWQAVIWNVSEPSAAPIKLPAAGLDVLTIANAINQQGYIVGVSHSSAAIDTPVLWIINGQSVSVTVLPSGGLLDTGLFSISNTNCHPIDVSDVNPQSGQATVIANCPNAQGTRTPVAWVPGLFGPILVALPLPTQALFCIDTRVNVTGQIMGSCEFAGTPNPETAFWVSTSAAPLVLAGANVGIDMNASGQIAGIFQTADGFTQPFYWDAPNHNYVMIGAFAGGSWATVVGIGDNGDVIGNSETSSGDTNPFVWTASGGTTDLGTLEGGSDAVVNSISKLGLYVAGTGQTSDETDHATINVLSQVSLEKISYSAPSGQLSIKNAESTVAGGLNNFGSRLSFSDPASRSLEDRAATSADCNGRGTALGSASQPLCLCHIGFMGARCNATYDDLVVRQDLPVF